MKKLLILTLFLSNTLYSQSIKIKVHKFQSDEICHRLNCDDTAAVISLAEEEGVDNAFVMKVSEQKMLVTMKCDDCEVQYVLYDRYIHMIVKYYPTKTLFYDKNYNVYKPKTCD